MLILLLVAGTGILRAYDFQVGGIYFDILADQTNAVEVTASSTSSSYSDVVIPDSVKYQNIKYCVTSIGDSAFYNHSNLKTITIGNCVTKIGDGAFSGCGSLKSVIIGNSVTDIGRVAFAYCSGLNSITCEAETPPTIGYAAFHLVSLSTPIYVPGNCIALYQVANTWQYFTNIQAIIPSGRFRVDSLCYQVISNQTNAVEVTYDVYLSTSNYSGLTHAVIPDSISYKGTTYCVASIRSTAFYSCRSLKSVTIGNNVTSIGDNAFATCYDLTTLTIGNSVISIGMSAFLYCDNLASITCKTITPPALGLDPFYGVNKSIPLFVPVNSIPLYQAADTWKDFTNIQIYLETIHIDSAVCESDLPMIWNDRSILAAGSYIDTLQTIGGYDSIIQILDLIVHPTYYIEEIDSIREDELPYSWQNQTLTEAGNYSVSYPSVHGCDSTITLQLMVVYTINAIADHGRVEGIGAYQEGSPIALTVVPEEGFEFLMWSDGTTTNPKEFIVQQDTTFRALFYMPDVEQDVEVDSVGANSVTITWDTVPGAMLYELRVYKDIQLVATYQVDANNNILNETFNGPDRLFAHSANTDESPETLEVEVSGLEPNQYYTYSLDALDADRNYVGAQSGSFTTEEEDTGLRDSRFDKPYHSGARKVLHDGYLFIELPDGTRYDARGVLMQ